jgi:hypothetical protein
LPESGIVPNGITARIDHLRHSASLGRIDARLQMAVWLAEKINLCQIDQLVTAAAEDSFEHKHAEPVACSSVMVGGIESSWR